MSEDSTLRGSMLSLDTNQFKTTLTKSKVTELIDRLEALFDDDEKSNADKYKIIEEILEEVTQDKFEAYPDKVDIEIIETGIKEAKHSSNPDRFISVLLKVLERQEF